MTPTLWKCMGALLLTVLLGLSAWLQEQERLRLERVEQERVTQEMRKNFQRPHNYGNDTSWTRWKQP